MINLSKRLISWYLINRRELPWRGTKDPYRIWLSEIILQQTRVEQGTPYYKSFIKAYPTVKKLADAPEDEVLKRWQGLGYYSRARNLHITAKTVAFDLDGRFPDTYKQLKTLKGVGDYTASAIASICFDEAAAVVDGNVYRVLSRIFGIKTPINTTAGQKEFKQLAQKLIDKDDPATFNQAMMEFGAIHCKPKQPYCLHCPFSDDCIALQTNSIEALPVKKGKTKVRNRYFNYAVFISEKMETALQQRTGKGIWRGLFEFPLLESDHELNMKDFSKKLVTTKFNTEGQDLKYDTFESSQIELFNPKSILHKLSHQNLYVKFWIVRVKNLYGTAIIPIEKLEDFAVPRVIDRFLEAFNFERNQ